METGGRASFARIGAALAVPLLLWGASAQAQEDRGGITAGLRFSQGLTFSTEDDTTGNTDLGFTLRSETRRQSFDLDLSLGIEERLEDPVSADVIDPTLTLGYAIESRNTAISADLRYSRSDFDGSLQPFADQPQLILEDQGTEARTGVDLSLDFGREMRFGGALALGYDSTLFQDTADPDLIDSETVSAALDLRFEIDRRITATLGYSLTDLDRDGGTDVRTERLSLGADLEVSQTRTANVNIGVTRVSESGVDAGPGEEGLTFGITVTEDRPNGDWVARLTSRIDEAGRRSTATLTRSLETRDGGFSATLGLTEGSDEDLRPLVELSYNQELPAGSLSVSLEQDFSNTTDGNEVFNTRLNVDWSHELSRALDLSTGFALQDSEVIGADGDTSQADLSLGLSRELTRDWSLTARYTYRITAEDVSLSRGSDQHILFVGLETEVSWRP